ncbi:hypothetical protein ACGFNQ_35950 [Streptomyces asoensis]|uniref:hypothetical protein n=1 Tax=Streptomyces asoensis TaxID=249586 RepID=UPI003713B640
MALSIRCPGTRFLARCASHGLLDLEPVEAAGQGVVRDSGLCGVRCLEPEVSLLFALLVIAQLVKGVSRGVGLTLAFNERFPRRGGCVGRWFRVWRRGFLGGLGGDRFQGWGSGLCGQESGRRRGGRL